ncbi:rhomboid family GlyGly-CTERM serine protease [Idiomarina sp. A28L]|uniref:rhombosortase n=1 Tax=Idiomarina sp. A28L TaxID=1036674 RepID=UPI00021387FB|nr:rhombosortase [Idiomarina sp. A28L]EGN75723.1 rhomboid family GlyGly-CTERM serine protease [Idiomarina sp. A28L]
MSLSNSTNKIPAVNSLRTRIGFLLAPVILAIVLVAIHMNTNVQSWLVLSEENLLSQPWRIFTTHLVHLNDQHLWVNVAALILISILFRSYIRGRLLMNVMMISALGASLIPILLAQDYNFVGLSGVLHGVFVYVGVSLLRTQRALGVTILMIVVIKLAVDLILAVDESLWLGAQVAYLCHIGGAVGGALAVPGLRRKPIEIVKPKE